MSDSDELESDQVNSVLNALNVIEVLYQIDGGGASEVARELDLAKSTVYSHLQTLEEAEYVAREGDQYHVGLKFLKLGVFSRSRKQEYTMSEQKVRELAEETQERSQFIVEEHGRGVYLHREVGDRAVHTDPGIGKRIPLHSTAAGKAILAELSSERIEAIIDRWGLEATTKHTITDPDELRADLEEIQERGYAINLEENVPGLHAVGVAVTGDDNRVCGALSVSGPSHRFKGDILHEEIPDLLLGAANELELNLMYS